MAPIERVVNILRDSNQPRRDFFTKKSCARNFNQILGSTSERLRFLEKLRGEDKFRIFYWILLKL